MRTAIIHWCQRHLGLLSECCSVCCSRNCSFWVILRSRWCSVSFLNWHRNGGNDALRYVHFRKYTVCYVLTSSSRLFPKPHWICSRSLTKSQRDGRKTRTAICAFLKVLDFVCNVEIIWKNIEIAAAVWPKQEIQLTSISTVSLVLVTLRLRFQYVFQNVRRYIQIRGLCEL